IALMFASGSPATKISTADAGFASAGGSTRGSGCFGGGAASTGAGTGGGAGSAAGVGAGAEGAGLGAAAAGRADGAAQYAGAPDPGAPCVSNDTAFNGPSLVSISKIDYSIVSTPAR